MPPLEAAPTVSEAAPVVMETPAAAKFEEAKAARRESAPPPEAAKPTPPTAEIEMTPEQLKAATALSKEARAARQRIKELETKGAEVEPLTKAKQLAAEGKHLEAIRAMGIDLNAAVAEELGTAPPPEEVDPKAAELAKTIEDLKADSAERKKADEAAKTAAAAAARETDVKAVVEHVKADPGKYQFLSKRVEWVQEAYEGAAQAYPALVEKAGRELNPEEKHRLMVAALEEAEEEHKKTAAIYGAPMTLHQTGRATPQKASARPTGKPACSANAGAAPVTRIS